MKNSYSSFSRKRLFTTAEKGFTLIEILIALAVFAVFATLTTSILYNAFTTHAHVKKQSEYLNELQLAISLIQQDTSQIIERAIRGTEMHLFPSFIGQTNYLEFTRGGNANPGNIEKRSTLKRIAYVCQGQTLIRRAWTNLDPIDHDTYEEKQLLTQLNKCHFGYLNQNLQVLPEWRENAIDLNQHKEPFPKAIQVNMTLRTQGEINLLFVIPGALYATS